MFIGRINTQAQKVSTNNRLYNEAFDHLAGMLSGEIEISLKDAVYQVENAYLDDNLSYDSFNLSIEYYTNIARLFLEKSELDYMGDDKENIRKNGAIFTVMTAKENIYLKDDYYLMPDPFLYDFDDFWGERDWTNMFVSKLLNTHSGNCHSLPLLYKILAEELEAKAYLSFAPNHTYIKVRSQNPEIGWYNTELTSATFPIDAWIKSSGYVHLDAIKNGIYMDTLSKSQEIVMCMIDLAKGYERHFKKPDDLDFLVQCADTALAYYPNYVNAMLLKAETLKKKFEAIMDKEGATYASQVLSIDENKTLFEQMETLYAKIFRMGYRTMPKEMYAEWLSDLNKHADKYTNKALNID